MDRILAIAVLVVAPAVALGQVYRWTDERGVVNYSNTPPRGVAAVRVPDPELPVLAAPPGETVATPRPDPELRERVESLERELAVERRQRVLTAQADDDRARRAREECERQRRVDCDQPDLLPEHAPIIIHPRVRPRPNIVPTLPVPEHKPPPPTSGMVRKDGGAGKMAPGKSL